jgi:MFS family permease
MKRFGGQVREAASAFAEVFRNQGLRRLNLAFAGSVVGDWAYAVAVSVYAYSEGGATAVGVLGVVRYLAMALIGPFTSTLADRHDRRRLMVNTDILRFVLVVVAAAAIAADKSPIVVYAIAVGTSVAGTAFRPAQAALLPKLATHPSQLTAANVVSSTIESVGFFVGPAIAGLLLAVTDIEVVFAFNALTYLWSAAMVRGLQVPADERSTAEDLASPDLAGGVGDGVTGGGGFFARSGAGFRVILRDRDIRLLVGLYCAQTVVAGASLVFQVGIAFDLLDLGESGLGVLSSVIGVGGLAGGFLALLLAQRGRLARDFGVGVILWSAPLLLVSAFPDLATALLAMAAIGLANSIVDVNSYTILQRLVPDDLMGRVFGAMESALIAGMALGALLMPLMMETIGLRAGLAVLGGSVSLLVLLGATGLRRIDHVALAPEGLGVLRGVPMLAILPSRLIESLARSSHRIGVGAGDTVFSEGDPGDVFFVIEDGSADVTIRGEHIRTLHAGDSFGEIALLRDIPRTATVTAVSDLVLRGLHRDDFVPAVTMNSGARSEADLAISRFLAVP